MFRLFKKRLQLQLIEGAKEGRGNWQNMFSPRLAIYAHPLRRALGDGNAKNVGKKEIGISATRTCVNGWLRFAQ